MIRQNKILASLAIVSFIVLTSVQFFLLYNTYELKNDHYTLSDLGILNNAYTRVVANDKVMPGGQKLLDRYLVGDLPLLERTWNENRPAFDTLAQLICDSAFRDLRKANNMDSLLGKWIDSLHLHKNLEYALLVERIDIALEPNKYINLYDKNKEYPLIDKAIQSKDGIYIGGTLKTIAYRNLASFYGVGSPMGHSSRVEFSLHADIRNRKEAILLIMMPTFLLSLFSILCVVLLFYITFVNWLRQRKLSEMKSDFINSITHEFNTPLSAIIVANKAMQNEKLVQSKESLQPLNDVIQRQSERLRTLINQVLDITAMNKIQLVREDLSIHAQLDDILLDYRLKLNGSDADLRLYKDAEKDEVRADRFWLTTIVLNILDNAVKYNDKDQKVITVSTVSDKKFLYLRIRDNGVGIAREARKHVFEKFYRSASEERNGSKGLGLGLYYVKQAIDAHHWNIEVTSENGEGSTFTIAIPV